MKFLRYVLPIAVACSFSTAYADDAEASFDSKVERDIGGASTFVKSKREYTLQEKLPNLNISGDVRAKWTHYTRSRSTLIPAGPTVGKVKDTGKNTTFPANQYNLEFNLMFDYKADRTWMVGQVKSDNSAGSDQYSVVDSHGLFGSGTSDKFKLSKAYIGYNVLEEGASRFDVEIGRRSLYDLFDSRMQFQSRFDGVALKYSNAYEGMADAYLNAGAFVVDQNMGHYGFVGELGMLDIADLGLDVKYSMIHWLNKSANRSGTTDPVGARFLTSQVTAAYTLDPEYLDMKAQVYGAFLVNHKARATDIDAGWDKKLNTGWYAGIALGEVRKEGDYSVDLSYQHCGAQVTPDIDNAGIGRGYKSGDRFKPTSLNMGSGNYKGVRLDASYGVTDNMAARLEFDYARAANNEVFGAGLAAGILRDTSHRYTRVQITGIYAF
ncbi:MAG: hypothetical protein K0S07_771 [Chlamydiales bacterium]|jgi:hypothetical protein|nr:hypothetical protein [Chlamydiales bacterium]